MRASVTERGEEERESERELVGEIIECERERERVEGRNGFSKMLLK